MNPLHVALLGPLLVTRGGRRLHVPAGRQRALLATLALRSGSVVPVADIIDRLWHDEPPRAARTTLRGHVKHLRHTLGQGAGDDPPIAHADGGYRLSAHVEVDVRAFHTLLARSDEAGSETGERALLVQALRLWRGTPLSDVESDPLHSLEGTALREVRLRAVHRRIELDLRLRPTAADRLAPELYALLAEDPLQERFWAQLLHALRLAGRPAEALREYERCRARLSEELGVDPGPALRAQHGLLLAEGTPPTPPRRKNGADVLGLPPDPGACAGKSADIEVLDSLLGAARHTGRHVVVLHGPAGVGKTRLAVHWAHHAGPHFPDGCLFVPLGPGRLRSPDDALRSVLAHLGFPPEEQPRSPDARAVLLRTAFEGRHTLLIIDRADCAETVLLLAPGPDTHVLVTSRHPLPELAREGAYLHGLRHTGRPRPAPATLTPRAHHT